jgi:ketosteroid isomerase-like protein
VDSGCLHAAGDSAVPLAEFRTWLAGGPVAGAGAALILPAESYSLATEPEGVVASLIERFNSGKVSAMTGLYDSEAVLIADDGRTVTDRAEIAAELERCLSLGLPLEAKARHVFVAGDIAEIVVDWSIDGTGPDGEHVHVEGSASDIARRGADGLWRNLIDNRRRTAVRQPA